MPENPQLELAPILQKPVFALLGCQQMSVNTLLCDTLGLAELFRSGALQQCFIAIPLAIFSGTKGPEPKSAPKSASKVLNALSESFSGTLSHSATAH